MVSLSEMRVGVGEGSKQRGFHPGLEGGGQGCMEVSIEKWTGSREPSIDRQKRVEGICQKQLLAQLRPHRAQVATCCWNKALATGGCCHPGRGNMTSVQKH